MKVVIMAGGLPSTISDEQESIPKPMVEIGERPILWHIMKLYSYYGFQEFIICAGYKAGIIKEYFRDYYIYQSDITVDLQENKIEIHNKRTEPWKVTILDTGRNTGIGERLYCAKEYLQEDFFVSYGDCVSNIPLNQMVVLHQEKKKFATIAVAHPEGRNKVIPLNENGDLLLGVQEQLRQSAAWVNASTMLLSKDIFDCLSKEDVSLEHDFFKKLADRDEIAVFQHEGFWSAMETKRDRNLLESLWKKGNPPWKVWEDL